MTVMMKNTFSVIFAVVFILLLTLTGSAVGAEQEPDSTEAAVSNASQQADELLSEWSADKLLSSFFSNAGKTFFSYGKTFAVLIFITFMLGVINAVTDSRAAMFAGETVLCAAVFSVVSSVISNVTAMMEALESFILSMLPAMTALYTASSAPVTAASSYGSTMLILNICSAMFSSVLLPAVRCLTVFAAVTLISRSFNFQGFSGLIRSIINQGFGITMCIMSACVFFQTMISTSKDGIASRAVRYAASSVIPVIGGVVSESARTVSESLRLVRSVSGAAGVFAIIGIVTSPLIAIAVCKFFLQLCSALAKLTGSVRVAGYYDELCGIMNLSLGACVGVSIVFILVLGIFSKTAITV